MKLFCIAVTLAIVYLNDVNGHGALWDPPMRGSSWRFGFNTPPSYNDLGYNCGNYKFDEDKCPACGFPELSCPSGEFCKNIIVKTYKAGATIPVMIHMGANHGGVFQFRLCSSSNGDASWDCLEKNRLKVTEALNQGATSKSGTIYQEPKAQDQSATNVTVHVQLPSGLKCDRCVFQWHWTAALVPGTCTNGTQGQGCGPQQTYINCADIKIN